MEQTTNLQLNTPDEGELYNVNHFNTNFEILDQVAKTWGTYQVEVSNWKSGTSGYYEATLEITGMLNNYNPTLIPIYSTSDIAKAQAVEFAKIVDGETIDGKITLKAIEIPSTTLKFNLVGI